MQTNAHADEADDRAAGAAGAVGAVATALDGVIVRGEHNLLAESAVPGLAGARAALETFYYAFNSIKTHDK